MARYKLPLEESNAIPTPFVPAGSGILSITAFVWLSITLILKLASHEDLAFITKLSKEPEEYKNQNDRIKILATISGARKGDLVRWYETLSDSAVKRKKNAYSNKPENLNLGRYERLLLNKLNDILEIIGFDMEDLKSKLAGHMIFQSA